ncbi:hypothetical protein V8G54_028734 [Vigna mungo]|uniref:Uncharacterized protein n=1 Tax=Vigna mungo TaxID=3915 RepID=A0AAQ3RL43_VIGMU
MFWGALGFLPPPKASESMNDVANQLLHELWSRSFLSEYEYLGGACRFKLHDLVVDLVVYIAKSEFEKIQNHNPNLYKNVHHLILKNDNVLDQALLPSSLRSIIFPIGANNEDLLNTMVSRCKFLRVLILESCEYASLPRCIGKLKHLRLLSLLGNKYLTEVPDSIWKLQNLQTLSLSWCIKLQKLPKGLGNLISLRVLFITTKQPVFPEKEASLVALPRWLQRSANSLQSLFIVRCMNLEELPDWLPTLNCLKRLSVLDYPKLISLPDNMHHLTNLKLIEVTRSSELWKRYRPEVGQDWHKISHVNLVLG